MTYNVFGGTLNLTQFSTLLTARRANTETVKQKAKESLADTGRKHVINCTGG